MQRRLRWVLVMIALATARLMCSPATAAEPYLSDMIKKPPYARALKRLLDHTGNLPNWTREVLKPKGYVVETPVTYVAVGGTTYEVFFSCQPHSCSSNHLAVMFAPDGARAWGALFQEGAISYLGSPSERQQMALNEQLEARHDYSLSDVLKKPDYARALKNLFDQAGNLPSWTQEALKPNGYIVEKVVGSANADRTTYEVLTVCMPHDKCEDTALVLMFAPKGTQAWGALFQEGAITYLGAPSDAQQAALKEKSLRGSYCRCLSTMIKTPAYARALKSLFDQTADLPDWAREALKPDGYIVESVVDPARIGETHYEMFFECMPHHCDRAALVLMFAPGGTQAWGVLKDDSHWPLSFLGAPSDAQEAVLQEVLYSKRDSKREQ